MFRRIEDFLDVWKEETEATLKVLRCLKDEKLDQRVYGEGRTLARLAWHLSETMGEMGSKMGLSVVAPVEHGDHPAKAEALISAYEKAAQSLARQVKEIWQDDRLDDDLPMYGETWKRGMTLLVLVTHQSHHRGQMTVLMRQAGLLVPGVAGPSKEEWAAMGLPPMK